MGDPALHGFTAWILVGAGKPEMLELADAWDSRIWWERSIEGSNPTAVTDVESLRRSPSFLLERIQTEREAGLAASFVSPSLLSPIWTQTHPLTMTLRYRIGSEAHNNLTLSSRSSAQQESKKDT